MADFTATIRTDNAAFADDPGPELARLLRKVADTVEGHGLSSTSIAGGVLMDANGARVGSWGLA